MTFDDAAFKRVTTVHRNRPFNRIDTIELNIDTNNDPNIKNLVIGSKSGLKISSITGRTLLSINITVSNLEISDLCSLIKREKLGSLNRFHIEDATLVDFDTSQLEGCYDASSKSPPKQLELFIADTIIQTSPGINGSHDVVFHTSPLTKYMEIHRVEFQDARKITFQSQHNNTAPEVFEIDHAYCHDRTLCVIESCNLTSCKLMTQALDPRRAMKSSSSNPSPLPTNFYLAFVAVLLLSVINTL
jgi:hypothetical protein